MSEVTASGAFFDGDPDKIMEEGIKRADKRVAEELLKTWKRTLEGRMRDSHGRYISGLQMSEVSSSQEGSSWAVHDDISYVYGPWLEGKGSRNHSTRFPGYHSLADATEEVKSQAGDIIQEEVDKIVGELNGR